VYACRTSLCYSPCGTLSLPVAVARKDWVGSCLGGSCLLTDTAAVSSAASGCLLLQGLFQCCVPPPRWLLGSICRPVV